MSINSPQSTLTRLLPRGPVPRAESDRRRGWFSVSGVLLLLIVAGCTQKMDNQPMYEPLEASDFFTDGRASRQPVPGTVPRGHTSDQIVLHSQHFLTGVEGGEPAATLPAELSERSTLAQILARGQQRYAIYCSHCHDLQGDGQGIVPQRGFPEPPTFHSQRLRSIPLGHIYRVIAYGRGKMPAHAEQIPPEDRWAIAAYVRALQLSQHADASLLEPIEIDSLQTPAGGDRSSAPTSPDTPHP